MLGTSGLWDYLKCDANTLEAISTMCPQYRVVFPFTEATYPLTLQILLDILLLIRAFVINETLLAVATDQVPAFYRIIKISIRCHIEPLVDYDVSYMFESVE